MRIVILGGYGIFGGRLCELLVPDKRLSLVVAGRSLASAESLCKSLPAGARRQALAFDRNEDPFTKLMTCQPDLVIDASGPFQNYGADPYRLVKACIEHGVHYMDFADGSAFVNGISQFDQAAKAKGIFILSGVSSFPVLTAAVVRSLTKDWRRVSAIRGGIAPSPFAVVGHNVIRAIAAYAGQRIQLVRDGQQTHGYALTETMRYTIAPPGYIPLKRTHFSLVDVPDLQVLPTLWPGLNAVWMGAGPVPEVLHRFLNGLAWLVRLKVLPSLSPLSSLFFYAINVLRWGEHRGGMFIEVEGLDANGLNITSSWHLLAEGKDGPYIPCMALEALIQCALNGKWPTAGARPASQDLEVEDYEKLFEQRTIFTGTRTSSAAFTHGTLTLFESLLGNAWQKLPPKVQNFHRSNTASTFSGTASVERGRGFASRLIATLFRFPAASDEVPVKVKLSKIGQTEVWERDFGGRKFSSQLSAGSGPDEWLLCERFGPFRFAIALTINNDKLAYVVRHWRLCGLPLPKAWAPSGNTFEFENEDRFCFNVEIRHPLFGLIVKYAGWLEHSSNCVASPS